MSDAFARLQGLLRQLFQFESKELDFGIYRIMNHKRGAIEDFIQNGLPRTVDAALGSGAAARQSARTEELRQRAEQVRETFGDSAIDAGGELKEGLREFPLGQQYLEARSKAGGAGEVFVNGDSFIPGAKTLDGVFKARMLAGPVVG